MNKLLLRFGMMVSVLLLTLAGVAQESPPQETVVLTIGWGNDAGEDLILRELLRDFEAEYDNIRVRVELTHHRRGVNQYLDILTNPTDPDPDLIRHTYYGGLSRFYLDLRPYLTNPDAWDANVGDGLLSALRGGTDGEELHGFLTDFTVSAPYINRDLWEAAGVPVPGDGVVPATWDEWERAAMQVQAALSTDENPVYALLMDSTGHRFWGPSLSMCADYFADDGSFQIDSSGFRDAAQMLRRWHVNGWMPPDLWSDNPDGTDARRRFVDGQGAFYFAGSWLVASFTRDIGERFDWQAVPNPIGNRGDASACDGRSGMPGGQVLTAIASTDHPEEVGLLMSFLTREENLRRFYRETLVLPAYANLQDVPIPYEQGSDQLNTFRSEIAEIDPQAYDLQYHPQSDSIRNAMHSELMRYVQGEITLDEAVATAQERIDAIISAANSDDASTAQDTSEEQSGG